MRFLNKLGIMGRDKKYVKRNEFLSNYFFRPNSSLVELIPEEFINCTQRYLKSLILTCPKNWGTNETKGNYKSINEQLIIFILTYNKPKQCLKTNYRYLSTYF